MSSKSSSTSGKTVTCPWCSKSATLSSKGGFMPHLTPGAARCVGTGMKPHPSITEQQAAGAARLATMRKR